MANITEKEQLEAIRSSFGTQADNFESSAMNFTKQEFLDYTVKAMELNKNDTVLEVAAGTCVCGRAIAPFVREVTCLDITPEMLQVGKEAAQKQGLTNMKFVVGDAANISLKENSFDVVIARLAFHHMLNPERIFSEMKKVLKPSGKLVLIDMEAATEELRNTEDEIEKLRDYSHVKNLSKKEMLSLYENEKLEVLKCESTKIPVSIEAWMELTKTPKPIREDITNRMLCELEGGKATGFEPYCKGGQIYFNQRWILIVGK